jgi:peptidoglycan glycosyltransferase
MPNSIQRVSLAFLIAFGILSLALGLWSIASPSLIERDDNPRLFFDEEKIQRGAILDRADRILAETIPLSGTLVRHYPDRSSAPVVGYYSINFGRSEIEEALDETLRGPYSFIDQLLHRDRVGRSVRLTIDATIQRQLADQIDQPGGAIVLSIPAGAIIATASYPSFDPNTLDENWKSLSSDPASPLLNRATQGLFQPGAIFETPLLADALERGQVTLTQTLSRADQSVTISNLVLNCYRTGSSPTLGEAYSNACPGPFADLGATLGETELLSIVQRWHLDTPPALEIRTSAALTATSGLTSVEALNAFAVGQGQLTVSPLQMALVAATIGNRGSMPAPYSVQDIQSIDGEWTAFQATTRTSTPIISVSTAQAILSAMHSIDNTAGHAGLAYSGNSQLAWFIGLAPADRPRYAIAVLIELRSGESTDRAEEIGRALLIDLLNTR